MNLGLKDKTAVVQASSKGLGLGTAMALCMEGVNTVICSRNNSDLAAVTDSMKKNSRGRIFPVTCDVTTEEGLEILFSECRKEFGDPDILVTNAGGPPPGDPLTFNSEDYSTAIDRTFLPAVKSVKEVLPAMMRNQWGRIIMITSAAVKQPNQNLILSNTARSALTAYAKTIATETAGTGVTINTVLPGIHDTSRVKSLVEAIAKKQDRTRDEVKSEWTGRIPVKRLGTIEEFGSLVTYLCSVQAGFITGQAIVHDGGATVGLL